MRQTISRLIIWIILEKVYRIALILNSSSTFGFEKCNDSAMWSHLNEFFLLIIYSEGYRPSFQCNEASNTSVLYGNNGTSPSVEYSDCWVDVITNDSVIKHSCSTGFNYSVPKSRTIITEVKTNLSFWLSLIYWLDCLITRSINDSDALTLPQCTLR